MLLVLVSYNNTELLIQIGIIHSKMFIIYSPSRHSNLYNFLFFPYFKEYFKNRIGPIYKNTETFLRTTTFVFHRKFLSNQKPTEKIIWRNKKVFNEQTQCGKLWMFIVPWIHLKLHYEILTLADWILDF